MKETAKYILLIASTLLQGCVSFSTLQSARTLGDEAASLTLAASSVNTGLKFEEGPGYRVPLLELQGAYGWNDIIEEKWKSLFGCMVNGATCVVGVLIFVWS